MMNNGVLEIAGGFRPKRTMQYMMLGSELSRKPKESAENAPSRNWQKFLKKFVAQSIVV